MFCLWRCKLEVLSSKISIKFSYFNQHIQVFVRNLEQQDMMLLIVIDIKMIDKFPVKSQR